MKQYHSFDIVSLEQDIMLMDDKEKEIEMLTIKDVSRIMKVSRKTAYRIIVSWGVRIVRNGRIVRIIRSDFEAAIVNNTAHW